MQPLPLGPLGIAALREEETHQACTWDRGVRKKLPVDRGSTVTLAEVDGCGYVAQLWLTFPGWFWRNWEPQAPVSATILKTLLLRIYWDNSDRPAVEVPVGDFFGCGLCEVANFTSRYIGMSSGGFYSRFPMPFRSGFRIEVENRDEQVDTQVYANILYQLTDGLPGDTAWFHGQFRTGENEGPDPMVVAEASGRGHFAGCTLSMQAGDRNYLGFLESPEQVFIDGDRERPRIAGTGLEDYFMGGVVLPRGAVRRRPARAAGEGRPQLDGGDVPGPRERRHPFPAPLPHRVHQPVSRRGEAVPPFVGRLPVPGGPRRPGAGGPGDPAAALLVPRARPRSPEHSLMGEEGQTAR